MSSQPTLNPPAGAPLLERLAADSKQIAYGLIAAGLVLGSLVGGINYYLYKFGSLTTLVWAVLVGSLLVITGLVYLLVSATETTPTPQKQANNLRMVLLGVAAGLGLLTAIYGIALALSGKPYFAQLDYPDIIAGGVKKWRDPENGYQNAWALTRCLAAVVLGLVLMFAGLHLARTFERTSQGLRRLLYGYNAVLSTLLLGFVLLLINIMSYTNVMPFKALGRTYDWTGGRFHTLSESTETLLASLQEKKQPVMVYLLLSDDSPASRDTETMLNLCRQRTDQLDWEALSPQANMARVRDLMAKYGLSVPSGMLVVYGREPNQTWDYTPEADLMAPSPSGPAGRSYIFKGEEALQKSLVFLSQNKTKTVVYFTQSHGEPDINSHNSRRGGGGAGALVNSLRKNNYDVRELKLGPKKKEVPADADIVVVIDPHEGYQADEARALSDYLQGKGPSGKKGRLVFLAGVHARDGKMARTGLEGLLREHGVRVQDDRLLRLGVHEEEALMVLGQPNPQSNNPVAQSFRTREGVVPFMFEEARPLEKVDSPGGSFTVDSLVVTLRNQLLIRQPNVNESYGTFLRDLERNPDRVKERLLDEPAVLALAVSEGNPLANIPGHEGMGGKGVQPRLVVFGDAEWVSDWWLLETRFRSIHTNLFLRSLAWLRERPDIGATVETPERKEYQINAGPGAAWRLVLLPLALLLTAVVAMGLGVWVVRRR